MSVAVGTALFGGDDLCLIGGPCVIESRDLCFEVAGRAQEIARTLGVPYVFKASFDKANRTSARSFRGGGMEAGLDVLAAVRERFSVPVLTDVHEPDQCARVAEVCDVLQIPAFLSRQTDLLLAAGETGRVVNIKKGQFLAPEDIAYAADKVASTGNQSILLTERGVSFGYHALVVDMTSLPRMATLGYPVVFDATHSVQQPGGGAGMTSGLREYVPHLARAACGAGVDALFLEVHPDPPRALSDAATMLALDDLPAVLSDCVAIHAVARRRRPVTAPSRAAEAR